MKVYFACSQYLPSHVRESISQTIEEIGAKTERQDYKDTNRSNDNFNEAQRIFQNNLKNIKSSDIVIAEASYISSGIGYEISFALTEKKPVIVLFNLNMHTDDPRHIKEIPLSLKGNPSKYLLLKEYDSANLQKIIEHSIGDARAVMDTKFILIIPPIIDRYLEWNVKERGKSKAEITREAIEEWMKRDDSYQKYLNENDMYSAEEIHK